MFSQLPEQLKAKVLELLNANDFPAAKRILDAWNSGSIA